MKDIGQKTETIEKLIKPNQQGTYFTFPFVVDEDVASIHINYAYDRFDNQVTQQDKQVFQSRQEINIIDIGLLDPNGNQVGTSGSDKLEFFVSEAQATPGYQACRIFPGEWQILVGAYKVQAAGVRVVYKITITYKSLRLLKGDLHTHTIASDGVHTAEELAWKAKRNDLDFVAITDHNQMISLNALPQIEGITLIPGVEWTHYQGHANFLGVDTPFDGCFASNSSQETQAIFQTARQRGALITINHPFEECCVFKYDLETLPFDCLEIWNGPMRESNLKALGFWQSLLVSGKKIPVCAGSDYHKDTPFIFLGGPTTCVYALSAGVSDILQALKNGHAYLIFAPDGPTLEMKAGENAIMGDSVYWPEVKELSINLDRLQTGDVVRVVTNHDSQPIWQAEQHGSFQMTYSMQQPGFARVEVLRSFLPGIPILPALISNPIYFDAG